MTSYYYRARMYDPAVGRFAGKDPAGMVDGPNLYAYVGNSPVNFVDPSGRRMSFVWDMYGWGREEAFLFVVLWMVGGSAAVLLAETYYYETHSGTDTHTPTRRLTVDEFNKCGKEIYSSRLPPGWRVRDVVGKNGRTYRITLKTHDEFKIEVSIGYKYDWVFNEHRPGDAHWNTNDPLPSWWPC